jgi:hypothetical protein
MQIELLPDPGESAPGVFLNLYQWIEMNRPTALRLERETSLRQLHTRFVCAIKCLKRCLYQREALRTPYSARHNLSPQFLSSLTQVRRWLCVLD